MKKIIGSTIIMLVSLAFGACSGGGSPTPAGDTTTKKPVTGSTSGNALFYRDASSTIFFYDPATLTSTNITSGSTLFSVSYLTVTTDIALQTVTDFRKAGIYYGENGMLYNATVDTSGTVNIKQISSATNITTICDKNFLNVTNDYMFFKQPGIDGQCGTNDDLGPFGIHSGMDESSLILTPAVFPFIASTSATGIIDGWILSLNGSLINTNSDFTISNTIVSGFKNISYVSDFKAYTIFNIDGQYRSLNEKTLVLSSNLHTVANTGIGNNARNKTTVFFNDGKNIYSLLFDGSTNSTLIATEATAGTIDVQSIDGDLLIYVLKNATTRLIESIKTVNIKTGTINELVTAGTTLLRNFATNGSRVYYNRHGTGLGETIAGMILTDGTGKVEIVDSYWSGAFYNFSKSTSDIEITTNILNVLSFGSTNKINGGTLNSYDAATNTKKITLGTLPIGIVNSSVYGPGTSYLGTMINTQSFNDIFYIDVEKAQSFKKVTTTVSETEEVI